MRPVDQSLVDWKQSQCHRIDVGGLFARSKIAHKWKAPFRSLSLREAVSWRTQDLLEQSVALYDAGQLLGARILLRSAFETVAVLIYLNQLTRKVLSGEMSFHDFSDRTTSLLLGSRDESTPHKSLNIITILEKCEARYSGMMSLYAMLSESAHPNYEGMAVGYSEVNHDSYVVQYSNRWKSLYGEQHLEAVGLCTMVFHHEYNEEWADSFEELEKWIETNDVQLEATKERT
jgi:hypothetical protein